MAQTLPHPHQNVVVLVGDRFDAALFDNLNPFGLPPDSENRVLMGPIAQYTYGNGAFAFNVAPNRVSLHMAAPEIFPEPLLNAAVGVAKIVDTVRQALVVTGLGLNCDAILPVAEGGTEYCRNLLQPELGLLEAQSQVTSLSIQDMVDGVQYTRRYEPANLTQGRDLYLAINGHQDLAQQTMLEALGLVQQFRQAVETIHGTIA